MAQLTTSVNIPVSPAVKAQLERIASDRCQPTAVIVRSVLVEWLASQQVTNQIPLR